MSTVALDMGAVEVLMRETRAVSEVLAAAMSDADIGIGFESPASVKPPAVIASLQHAPPHTTSDLSPQLSAFMQAIRVKGEWTQQEAEQLAREHGLMLNGAIEAINEWSIDATGDLIVEHCADRLAVRG
jgi:hypothetical protein